MQLSHLLLKMIYFTVQTNVPIISYVHIFLLQFTC